MGVAISMTQRPQPNFVLLLSASMLIVPAILLLIAACIGIGIVVLSPSNADPVLICGAIVFPVPAMLLLRTEYRAIRYRDVRAVAWIACVCLGLTAIVLISWTWGLLGLVGVFRRDSDFLTWTEFGIYTTLMAYSAFIGFAHLKWRRALTAAGPVEVVV